MDLRNFIKHRFGWTACVSACLILFACTTAVMASSASLVADDYNRSRTTSLPKEIDIIGSDGISWFGSQDINILSSVAYDGGEKLLFPGINGSYAFSIFNVSDTEVPLILSFKDENTYGIPMQIRLSVNGSYLTGEGGQWIDTGRSFEYSMVLAVNQQQDFVLDWRWTELEDAYDTALGFRANHQDVEYVINMSARTEIVTDNTQLPVNRAKTVSPQTGDYIKTFNFLVAVCVLISFAAVQFIRKKIRRR